MGGRTEGQVHDNMEEKILREAGLLFMQKGFAGTSTTEIARNAGCNQALVHYYFRTKDNLFNRFFESKVREVLAEIVSVEMGGGDFRDKLSRMISLHFDIIRQYSPLMLFLINELTQHPEKVQQIIKALGEMPLTAYRNIRKDLDKEIELGKIRPVELMDIIINAISLNVFTFIAKPILGEVWGVRGQEMEQFLDRRKQEIVDTVLYSLRSVK